MTIRLACAALGLWLAACTTVPETGRPQVALLGASQELALGESAFREIKREKRVSGNAAVNAQVRRVGARIASVADVPNARWEFVVFEDAEPNAFALPGGKVGVNTGLLRITKTDAGLATILGHEVAHVAARHGSERISQSMLAELGGSAVDVALALATDIPASTRGLIGAGYGIGAQVGVLLPYSRLHESEADRIGLLYMARAGYDPAEAVGVWERLAAYSRSRGTRTVAFLSTHPVDEARIATIRKYLPEALAEYKAARGRL